jgi:DNA-binding NarL/FixJ family response regulator
VSHQAFNIDPAKASLVLVEDDALLSDLLKMALTLRFKPAALAVFSVGRRALEYCRTEKPDLVIVDIGLPDMDGRALIRALRKTSPGSRVIVLTGSVSPTLPGELLALGVSGYVDKGSELENAETAIRRVLAGGIHFSAGLGPVPRTRPIESSGGEIESPPEILSEREREIARLVAGGMISKEIAERLNLSPRTVEKSRAQMQEKLNVRDLPSLVRWCVKHGLV